MAEEESPFHSVRRRIWQLLYWNTCWVQQHRNRLNLNGMTAVEELTDGTGIDRIR